MAGDPLVDADTMARLSAVMRRAPYEQEGVFAGGVPAAAEANPFARAIQNPENPYNERFPDYIETPSPLPPNPYNEIFSDLVGRPPQEAPTNWGAATGPGSALPPAPWYEAARGITTPNLEDAERMRQFYARERLNAPVVDVSGGVPMPMRGGMPVPEGLTYREAAPFPAPAPTVDPGRAAQVEQLMRELEEQQALEARLRALGR